MSIHFANADDEAYFAAHEVAVQVRNLTTLRDRIAQTATEFQVSAATALRLVVDAEGQAELVADYGMSAFCYHMDVGFACRVELAALAAEAGMEVGLEF